MAVGAAAANGGRPTSSTGADTVAAVDTEGADTTTDTAAVVDTEGADTAMVVMAADTEEEADTGAGPCEGAGPDTPIVARGRTGGADREEEDTVGEVGGVVSGLWSGDWLVN